MMATSENGANISNDIDIDALIMPDVNESEVSAVVDSLHQELTSSTVNNLPESQNSDKPVIDMNQTNNERIDLIKTVKTEGEASDVTKTTGASSQLTLNLSSPDPNRRQNIPLMSPFSNIAPQTPLTPNSQIVTAEEQAAIQKQAGLLVIHNYCSKHGSAKAKEILDGVTKVKNFLTNLIQLASKYGPQVHSFVHSLVQKLVGGSINEDEFAMKIEEVLKSKHQPNLLPFLKNSISDLRQHIFLQKSLVKQLMEKKVNEKMTATTSESRTSLPTTNHASSPSTTIVKQQTPSPSHKPVIDVVTPTTSTTPTQPVSLTPQQQQILIKQHLSKLPEAQKKAYLNKIQLQLLKQQIPGATASTQQQLSVLFKQQEHIRQQQQQMALSLGSQMGGMQSSSPKKGGVVTVGGGMVQRKSALLSQLGKKEGSHSPSQSKVAAVHDNEEDEEEGMDIAGVNLKEETAHFLPSVPESVSRSISDRTFVDPGLLKERMLMTARLHGIVDVADNAVSLLSHAMEERLRNVLEKLTVVNKHRTENLKDDDRYQMTSDTRGQLKILGKIDQISANRREEREKEMIFKAAKSRSKQDDPELAKKKEQAKQIQLAQEREIHQKAANETALAAIGRRKRTATTAFGDNSANTSSLSEPVQYTTSTITSSSSSSSSAAVAAVFSTPGVSRAKQKRKLQARDVLFVMEQERETKKSLLLYKSLLN